ncbi:RHS domain-containing protein [Delftia sp. UME58]|uniref:RHS domain-containing protein n=1 Tax=Delftia sp. UME58 TaxID=1862322 RepID=UPI001D8AA653|nr:RHS domain-containing protein [Delftia sp. UME58]MBB1652735.1 hypothetical protein [Delftia sp. UME58]
MLSDIERDALHQEIERTQGTLTSRYGWNPIGSFTTHKASQQGALQGQPGRPSPQALLESEWRSEEHCNVQVETEAAQASFATYYYQCDQIGAPQELTDEAGRIVWAASYKVWGQTRQLQHLRTGTDDAAAFTHDQRPLALVAHGEVQSLALVEQPRRFQGTVL